MILSLDGLKLRGQCQACWGGDAKPGRRRLVVKATDAAFDAAGVEKTGKIWVKQILMVMQSGY